MAASLLACYPRTSLVTSPCEDKYGASPHCCLISVGLTEENVPDLLQENPCPSSSSKSEIVVPIAATYGIDLQEIPSPSSSSKSQIVVPVRARYDLEIDEEELIYSLAGEIRECGDSKSFTAGEEAHARIVGLGLESDRYLSNFLISMYGNCCSGEAAEAVFLKIENPNIFSSNILINAYAKNGELSKAKVAFGNMSERNSASWNAIISGLAKNGDAKGALHYYQSMLDEGFYPDVITFVAALDACADILAIGEGMEIHASITHYGYLSDMIVGTALINMYGRCGGLDDARQVFQHLTQHDVTSWTAMISACITNDCYEEALNMFGQLQLTTIKPTRATFLATLDGCGKIPSLSRGYEMHAFMLCDDIDSDIMVENALIDMYGKCRSLVDGVVVFHKMLQHNVITWSALMASHAGNRNNEEAVRLFYRMQAEGINPNNIASLVALGACASMQDVEKGRRIHDLGVCFGIEGNPSVVTALINMYGECERLEDARAVFCSLEERGVSVWNSMLLACVYNGQDKEVMTLFEEMQSKGVKPDKKTLKIIEGGWM